jgi:hypothetical protein
MQPVLHTITRCVQFYTESALLSAFLTAIGVAGYWWKEAVGL